MNEIAIDEKNLIEGKTGKWEVILGLEVHAQVISNSKLFSAAATTFAVKVTLCPLTAGSTLEVRIVTVCAFVVVAGSTVRLTGAEIELKCVVSPE